MKNGKERKQNFCSISGGNVIKLFLSMIYGLSYKARVFVRIGWKRLSATSLGTLAYSENLYITDKNSFISLTQKVITYKEIVPT
jgi:hypothetical protein